MSLSLHIPAGIPADFILWWRIRTELTGDLVKTELGQDTVREGLTTG